MNFFAIPTLNTCAPACACHLDDAALLVEVDVGELRTGIDSAGSRLRPAAEITVSATLTSFFSTGVGFFAVGLAMVLSLFALGRLALRFAAFVVSFVGVCSSAAAVARLGAGGTVLLPRFAQE